jgi:hypothetical protein
MENVVHVGAIVKMQQKLSVRIVQSLRSAALMRWLFKSRMESGEVYQKMIASQLLEK